MKTLKNILGYVLCLAVTFLLVWLFVFVGGWKFFESNDPILIELGVSVVLSFIVYLVLSIGQGSHKRIEELEKRVEELENKK